MTPRAVLVGPPGAGKSTIGRRLAHALDVELLDTDVAIERHSGRTVAEIFAQDGEPAFRAIEETVVRDALTHHDGIVSLGGGAILSSATRALLTTYTVIYLEISVAEGLRRTSSNTARPLLAGPDPRARYQELMRHRRPLYRSVASIRMRTDGRSPARVVAQLVTKLDNYAASRQNRIADELEHVDTAPRQMAHPAARAIRRDDDTNTNPPSDPDSGTDKSEVSQ